MGGEGSIAGMIISYRNNRNLQKSNREHRKELRRRLNEKIEYGKNGLEYKHLSKRELEAYKLILKRKKEIEHIKIVFLIISLSVIVFLLLNYLFNLNLVSF